jgi:hypothetical protein
VTFPLDPREDDRVDARGDRVDIAIRVDACDAARGGFGNVPVSGPDALVKSQSLYVETIGGFAAHVFASSKAAGGFVEIDVEPEGEVRNESVGGEGVELGNSAESESSAIALKCDRGIDEAVAQNDRPPSDSGLDDLVYVLGSRSGEEEKFGVGRDIGAFALERERAKCLAERGTSGLTRRNAPISERG